MDENSPEETIKQGKVTGSDYYGDYRAAPPNLRHFESKGLEFHALTGGNGAAFPMAADFSHSLRPVPS
jgi:hypothetical protein